MIVEELKCRITYTEFLEWLDFLLWEEGKQTKQDYYMAQIACEVRRGQVRSPGSVQIRDFLIQKRELADKAKQSKLAWASHLHLNVERN